MKLALVFLVGRTAYSVAVLSAIKCPHNRGKVDSSIISYFHSMQVFVFVTISKFGALNCALIGLGRKMLSLLLSFILYGHTMNAIQTVGLSLSLVAMIANFYEKVSWENTVKSGAK